MKRLTGVLTLALVAAIVLTGCSKDESEIAQPNAEQTTDDKNQKIIDQMKEHIVGTWKHDGDFLFIDIKELGGTIKDGIIYDCNSEFDDCNPATLTFHSDGTFELKTDNIIMPQDGYYTGRYTIEKNSATGKPCIWLIYDADLIIQSWLSDFHYNEIYFEENYNTVYLVSYGANRVGRYRRI